MRKSSHIRATDAGPLQGPGSVQTFTGCCDDWYSSWSYLNPVTWPGLGSRTIGIAHSVKPLIYPYKITVLTGVIITMPNAPTRSDLLLNLGLVSDMMGGGILAKVALLEGATGQMTLRFGAGYHVTPEVSWVNPQFAIQDGLVPGVDEDLGSSLEYIHFNGVSFDEIYPVPDNFQVTAVFNDCAAGGLDTHNDRTTGWLTKTLAPLTFTSGTTVLD